MLKIIEKTKIWFAISLTVIIIGMVFLSYKGLDYGIDFKGGTVIEIDTEGKEFNKAEADALVKKYAPDASTLFAKSNDKTDYEIKGSNISEENITNIFKDIKDKYKLTATGPSSQETIGAALGNEMKKKAVLALVIATVAMLIYIGIRFEFRFGVAAILSLIHDVLIMVSVYAIFQIPVDSGFVAAILTVIGYSINDTIVVFDRIRENQKFMRKSDPAELANASITQTLTRSIYTVLTVLITLVALYAFVPAIRSFSKPLLVGITSGCYSSIFIATPFWVIFKNKSKKKKLDTARA